MSTELEDYTPVAGGSEEPTGHRRFRVVFGAGLVVVVAGFGVLWWLGDDAGDTVAVIPSTAMLDASNPISHLATATDAPALGGLVIAGVSDDETFDRVVGIGHGPIPAAPFDDLGDAVSVGDREGYTFQSSSSGNRSLSVPDGNGWMISLWSTPAVELADLIGLALAVDLDTAWGDQQFGADWTILGAAERGATSTYRAWELTAPEDPSDPAGGMASPAAWVVTHTDTEADPIMFFAQVAPVSSVQVRGTTGTLMVGPPGYFAIVIWEEAPGVIVRLRYGPSDDPVGDALEYAEALVAVGAGEWQSFSDTHDGVAFALD
jgi:hypothetical protein